MAIEKVNVSLTLNWTPLLSAGQLPYCWGDTMNERVDPLWGRGDVIYRWVRSSDGAVAYIGIPKKQTLAGRIRCYINGKNWGLKSTNHRVYDEQVRLVATSDSLILEVVTAVQGYNLAQVRERGLAEALLIGCYRPYLQ